MRGRAPSRRGKRSTQQHQTEREGIALCDSLVTAMGHIWRGKGVDYGIDGEVELIDDGQVLNRVLWVQSKAQRQSNKFAGETDKEFRYTCSEDDLHYWLSGTAPVLLVCSHPDVGQAWFKHLPSWFADPRHRRDRQVVFDKVADRFDPSSARRLLTLGVDAASGIYLSPAPRHETLTTNLLTVANVADRVHVAPTKCRTWPDAQARWVKAGYQPASDVVFHSDNLYSFRPLDQRPFDVLLDGPVEAVGTDELAESHDDADHRLVVWLLNNTLRDITYRELRRHPDYLYFKARSDGIDRQCRTGSKRARTVVKRYEPAEGATWIGYTRHDALEYQFTYADGDWYLSLVPTYHFTFDGYEDSPFAGTQLATIKRFEGHDAVRNQTRFWARYLSSPNLLFGWPDPRLNFGRLVELDVERGIDDKAWKPLPTADSGPPVEGDGHNDPPLTLFSLDEDGDDL